MPTEMVSEAERNYHWILERLTYMICDSIRDAGGVPLELYATDDEAELDTLAVRLDGFVFAGGDDIHPDFYNESVNGAIAPDLERDRFEFALLEKALERDKPILGICRGAQILNVGMGGTLFQHLPDVKPEWALHRDYETMDGTVHEVEIIEPQHFPTHSGKKMKVNSMHHQGIKDLAPGLTLTAVTGDGLPEAFFAPKHRYLTAVQWHPECMSKRDPVQAEIFRRIVEASAAR